MRDFIKWAINEFNENTFNGLLVFITLCIITILLGALFLVLLITRWFLLAFLIFPGIPVAILWDNYKRKE
jgi:hypothetical protein